MGDIFCFSSWGWRGAETVINVPGGPGLALRASGEELTAVVESLGKGFHYLGGASADGLDAQGRLLSIRLYDRPRRGIRLSGKWNQSPSGGQKPRRARIGGGELTSTNSTFYTYFDQSQN